MEKNTALATVRGIEREIHGRNYDLTQAVVSAVIDSGATWPEIGNALGVSKQTAHARYALHVNAERSGRKWAEENPERHAAAVAKGRADAAAALEEIQARVWKTTPQPSKISDTDVAGESETPSIFSDDTAPAKAASIHGKRTVEVFQQFAADRASSKAEAAKAEPPLQNWDGAIDRLGRAVYWLEGPADATAQPGTGVGDHNCPRCQSTNHKGSAWHTVAAFPECEPTRFDPQNIVDWFYRSMKITKTTASDQA